MKKFTAWIIRMVDRVVWNAKYKKVWLMTKPCPDAGLIHEPHAWALTHRYIKSTPVPYFCEGVKHD